MLKISNGSFIRRRRNILFHLSAGMPAVLAGCFSLGSNSVSLIVFIGRIGRARGNPVRIPTNGLKTANQNETSIVGDLVIGWFLVSRGYLSQSQRLDRVSS